MGMRGAHEIKRFVTEKGFGKFDALALALLVAFLVQGGTFYLYVHSARIIVCTLLAVLVIIGLWAWRRVLPQTVDAVCRKVFPVVLIICGVAFSLFFPPGSVPDGIYHFRTTYAYSNILAFQDADLMRASDAELIHDEKVVNKLITAEHWRVTNDELEIFSSDNSPVHEYWLTHSKLYDDDPVGVVTNLPLPQLKIPAALGIMFAKLIGLGAVPMFFLGRLFNMLYAAILIILAVRLTPIGKNMFMAASLMPMTLHILGSYSYDGPIIGMAFLLTALLLRAMRGGEEKVSKGLCIGTVAVASILAPCKVVYMTINLLVLFVPARRFNSRASCVMFKLCVLGLPILFMIASRFAALLPYLSGGSTGGKSPEYEGAECYTLGGLLSDPRATYLLFANTLLVNTSNYLPELVGGVPGWLEGRVALPMWASYFLVFLLFASSVRAEDDDECLPVSQRIVCVLLFVITLLATMLALAIDWTLNTDTVIQGVQGRYLIPVIILLLLALRSKCIQVKARLAMPLVMTLSGISFMYLAYIAFKALTG